MTRSLRVLEICEEKRQHRLAVNLLYIIAEILEREVDENQG